MAAFTHQCVVTVDFDAIGLQLNQPAKYVGGPVEQRARQHRCLDPAPRWIGFRQITPLRIGQAGARDVEAVLGMVEQASGQRFNQPFLGLQRIAGDEIRLDPVVTVKNPLLSGDDAPRAFGRQIVVQRVVFKGKDVGHGKPLFLGNTQ